MELDDLGLIGEIRRNWRDARRHSANWRSECRESFAFKDGDQWDDADTAKLQEMGRPVITFNRTGPYLDAVSGHEINSRMQIAFKPRTVGDRGVNEVYTEVIRWVRQQCDAEDQESDSFLDMLTCGMGWMEWRMDYDHDPDGMVVGERIDPQEMYWDPSARGRNLKDARWVARSKWLSATELKERWPDVVPAQAAVPWEDEEATDPHNAQLAFLYRRDSSGYDPTEKKFRVLHYQWKDKVPVHRVVDPRTGKMVEFDEKKWRALPEQFREMLQSVRQMKRVVKECFVVGDEVKDERALKCDDFKFQCMTGKRDRNQGTWYGQMRAMKDPQRWANKFFSQILHIVNSNAKGGLLAETSAFKDPRKAEEDWADPTAIVWLSNGGMNKIKERSAAAYPQGLDRLLQFAVASIPDVSGINLEFMGMVDRAQAGILEQERKKSAFSTLANYFDAKRLYLKSTGRLIYYFVNEFMSDGRVIRITMDEGEMPIRLERSNDAITYDIVVDESPSSPNMKEQTWQTMGQIMPALLKAGMPLPPDFFDFSPLPGKLADRMKGAMQGKLPPQVQEKVGQMQKELQRLTQENAQLKSRQQIEAAKLQSKDRQAAAKNIVNAQAIQAEYDAKLREIAQKNDEVVKKIMSDHSLSAKEQQHEIKVAVQEAYAKAMSDAMGKMMDFRTNMRLADKQAEQDERKAEREEQKKAVESVVTTKSNGIESAMKSITKAIEEVKTDVRGTKPSSVKKIRDKSGNMIAAEVTYDDGSKRRVSIH